jgi:hypothetical protein
MKRKQQLEMDAKHSGGGRLRWWTLPTTMMMIEIERGRDHNKNKVSK